MDAPIKSRSGYWQDLSDSDKVNHMLTNGYLTDCKFIVGPDIETAETIYAHKLMFIMASPVLENMLIGQFVEAKEQSGIRIEDAYPHDFKNFCFMIYNNNLSNLSQYPLEDVIELYRLCDKYMVLSTSKLCIQHLTNLLNNSSINELIAIFEFACGLEDKTLLLSVKKVIAVKPIKIDAKMHDLSAKVFYEYFQFLFQSNVSAVELFSAINSYYLHKNYFAVEVEKEMEICVEKNDKEKMAEQSEEGAEKFEGVDPAAVATNNAYKNYTFRSRLLKLINFNQMTTKDFINGPGKSRLLTAEQKYDILSKLCLQIQMDNNYF